MRHLCKKSWSLTAIRPILMNEIYRGEVIWNRSEWIRDHETNKRKRHMRPESEWIRAPRPELAIVPEDLWYRAQELRESRGNGGGPRSCGNRRRLLAGLLECGECGGAFHIIYKDVMGCGRREAGGASACGNTLRLDRREVEERVLSQLDELLRPDGEAIAWIRRRVLELVAVDDEDLSEHHLEVAQKRVANLLEIAADTGSSAELATKIREEEGRVRRLRSAVRHRPAIDSGKVLAAVEEAISDVREMLRSPDSRIRDRGAPWRRPSCRPCHRPDINYLAYPGTVRWKASRTASRRRVGALNSNARREGFEPLSLSFRNWGSHVRVVPGAPRKSAGGTSPCGIDPARSASDVEIGAGLTG